MNDHSLHLLPWESVQATTPGRRIQAEPRDFLSWGGVSEETKMAKVHRMKYDRGEGSTESNSRGLERVPLECLAKCWPARTYEMTQSWVKNHPKGLEEKMPAAHTGPGTVPVPSVENVIRWALVQ